MNLHHHPKTIMKYFGDEYLNIKISYSIDDKLLGTAGAVKKVENFFNDTFIVMSGDGLTDICLRDAIKFHKHNKSVATIILKEHNDKFEYGIIVTDKNKKISSFIEKPKFGKLFKGTVNTSIYIFESEIFKFIPKNTFFDFGCDRFPKLLKAKKNIFGYTSSNYWSDIGDVARYRTGVIDFFNSELIGKDKASISKKANIDKSAKIIAPCFIDEGTVIGKNVVIGRPSSTCYCKTCRRRSR
jgi:mannose-1-phosphate guanylyltransferase/phosphomannomutase